ncbi:MAG: hypothetical protein LAT64_02615 [Phycisphaerales bacterium]|nr:hypothetical protein [Planctomycetota bacterium]MCH8507651.1 hypothetical protein [Phycisphaerales bacterium]
MRPYDREIDSPDDDLVRDSVLGLAPAVTWQEIACVRYLAQRPFWLQPIESPFFDTWELEQLDRRGWIEAREVDLASAPGDEDHPRYEPRGPGFSPLHNHRTSGRPDWPSICTSFQWAIPQPTEWHNRLNTTIRLTLRGLEVAKLIRMKDLVEVGLFDDTAYQLQRISAGWRGRDSHVSHLLAIGVKTCQTHFEHEVRDRAMRSVSVAVGRLQEELIPKLALEVDPGFRDELRALARDLDPHAEVPDPDDDDLTHRWRLSWHQVRCEDRIQEMVPLLFEMQIRQRIATCGSTTPPESVAPAATGTSPKNEEFRVGSWFQAVTGDAIKGSSLQRAAKDGRLVDSKQVGGVWHHSVDEVASRNPERAAKIRAAIVDKSSGAASKLPDASG